MFFYLINPSSQALMDEIAFFCQHFPEIETQSGEHIVKKKNAV